MSVVSSSFPLDEACPAPPFWLPLPVAGLVPPFAARLESPGVSSGESSVPASMVDPPEVGREGDNAPRHGAIGGGRVEGGVFVGIDTSGEGERAGKQADTGRDDAQTCRRGHEGRVAAGHGEPQQHAAEGCEGERLEDGGDAVDELHERTPIHQAPPMTAEATLVTVSNRRSTNAPRNCEDSSATFFTSIIGP